MSRSNMEGTTQHFQSLVFHVFIFQTKNISISGIHKQNKSKSLSVILFMCLYSKTIKQNYHCLSMFIS